MSKFSEGGKLYICYYNKVTICDFNPRSFIILKSLLKNSIQICENILQMGQIELYILYKVDTYQVTLTIKLQEKSPKI